MNEDLIRTIANEIVNQSIVSNYKIYLLIIAISFVTGSIAAFLSSYFHQRGKQYATKADFDQILSQLEDTTRLTEEIKSDINAKSQDENNIKLLVREKLEAIFSETFQLELWLEKSRSSALNGDLPRSNESPIAKIEMYHSIYFKNIENEMLVLQTAYYPMMIFILDIAKNARNDGTQPMDNFKELHEPILSALTNLRKALVDQYTDKVGL